MASRSPQPSSSSALAPETTPAKASTKTPVKTPTKTTSKSTCASLLPSQRQYADILSFMAKHQLRSPLLGVAWDISNSNENTGGGDFLQPTQESTQYGFERVAYFLPYYLPGEGDCLVEPRYSALGLLYSCYGEAAFEMTDLATLQFFTASQLVIFRKMLSQKVRVSATSSVGRIVDGVTSLLNLHHYAGFEGQAALTLQFAATQSSIRSAYPFTVIDAKTHLIDWREMVKAIVEDCREAVMTPVIAAKFYNTLVEIIAEVAHRTNNSQIVLSGSCFRNKVLIERAIRRLSAEGFTPYWIE